MYNTTEFIFLLAGALALTMLFQILKGRKIRKHKLDQEQTKNKKTEK